MGECIKIRNQDRDTSKNLTTTKLKPYHHKTAALPPQNQSLTAITPKYYNYKDKSLPPQNHS